MLAFQAGRAASYVYTPDDSATDLWSAGTNWDALPVSGPGTELTFVGNDATVLPDGLTNTNTNDVAGPFSLTVLNLQGSGPAIGAATVNINGASGVNYLNFVADGSSAPVVHLDALAGAAGFTYNVASDLSLADDTTFQGDGTAQFNFMGAIGGDGGLIKTGTSTLLLGGSNTFAGLTTIRGGALVLDNADALATSTLDYDNHGGVLDFGTLSSARLGGLQGNQDLALTNASSLGLALAVGGNDSSGTYAGVLSDADQLRGGSLTKLGSGTLTLTGANTYRGRTNVYAGTLRLVGDDRLPVTTALYLSNNTAGVLLDVEDHNQTIGSLSGGGSNGGDVLLGSGTLTITLPSDNSPFTYGGVIHGDGGSLVVQGSGTTTAGWAWA